MQLEFEVGDKVNVYGYNEHEFTVYQIDQRPDGSRVYKATDNQGRAVHGIPERWLSPAKVPMKQAISNAVDRLARQVGTSRNPTCPPKAVWEFPTDAGYSLSEVARKLAERSSSKTCTCTGWQLLHRGHLDTCPGRDA